jgi:beta-RFAP synthase
MITRIGPRAGPTARSSYSSVGVTVPARLHLGFLDLDGGLGRRFGSLGITLDGPRTRLRLGWSAVPTGDGPSARRGLDQVARLARGLGLSDRVHLVVEEAIPEHVGLGSGTQLALAAGIAFARLSGLALDAREVARRLGRGARSGVGVGAFEQGGVILDGGRGGDGAPPPVLCRLPFPDGWRLLLVFDRRRRGKHGADEADAFRRLPPFPAELAGRLCRLMLMAALPALAERRLDGFAAAVAELQRITGDYFAPMQGGRFASPRVGEVLAWLEAEGVVGVGQSSWGPTGFALVGSEAEALALARAARRRWPDDETVDFLVCRGRNAGAEVAPMRAAQAAALRP